MKALALVLALLLPSADQAVFAFQDPAITEASGLVDLGALTVVTNDSGDRGIVYVVDAHGRTVGHTVYASEAWDTEALAPAGPGRVYVGDIGDNAASRASVRLWDVPVGRGERSGGTSYELRYPDGAHDAESLLRWRGRLHVVTKGLRGGGIYAAPAPLRTGRLVLVGSVDTFATDAAAIPGSSVALVRSYGRALAVRMPSGRTIGSFDMPAQQQGEAISVGPAGRVRVTSEGGHQEVIEVDVPAWVRRAARWSGIAEAAYDGAMLVR